jgi:predicted ArsR family transcriptional regulator
MITSALNKHKSLTTYQLAQKVGVSWATVNIHCYKLLSKGKVRVNHESSLSGKRSIWSHAGRRRKP